jgi:hypothetical protein
MNGNYIYKISFDILNLGVKIISMVNINMFKNLL